MFRHDLTCFIPAETTQADALSFSPLHGLSLAMRSFLPPLWSVREQGAQLCGHLGGGEDRAETRSKTTPNRNP